MYLIIFNLKKNKIFIYIYLIIPTFFKNLF